MPNANNNENTNRRTFETLVLAGGGAKGALYPGAIQALADEGMLTPIQTVTGSSAGALTAAMLAIGLSPQEIDNEFKKKSFADFLNTTKLTNGGLFSTGSLKRHINEVLYTHLREKLQTLYQQHKDKLSLNNRNFVWQLMSTLITADRRYANRPTFNDLGKIADIFKDNDPANPNPFKKLVVTMTEYDPNTNDDGKTVYCQQGGEFGGLSIAEAVTCSACLPIAFAPIEMNGKLYKDGGIYDNTPIQGFEGANPERTLALVFEEEDLAHEQVIFSKNAPSLSEATFSDKLIKAAFNTNLPQCVLNDATTVRDHAKNIIRLIVPKGLTIATMKLTPELAKQATVNGYMSVKAWLKAFRPKATTNEMLDEQEADSEDLLHKKIQQLHTLTNEKTALQEKIKVSEESLRNNECLIANRYLKYKFIDAKEISKYQDDIIDGNLALIEINNSILKNKEDLANTSKKLIESKNYARHYLTYQILAWKESISQLDNIFKMTLNNFINDIYEASKTIDDGKFFADNVDKISELISIFSKNSLDKINKEVIAEKINILVALFNDKNIFLHNFAYHASILLRIVHQQEKLAVLRTLATKLPNDEKIQEEANHLLARVEETMQVIFSSRCSDITDNCSRDLSHIIISTQALLTTISEAATENSLAEQSAPLNESSLVVEISPDSAELTLPTRTTSSTLNLSISTMTTPTSPERALARMRTQTATLLGDVLSLEHKIAIANNEKPNTQNKLSLAFDRFSRSVSRFFQATAEVITKPSHMFSLWRRPEVNPEPSEIITIPAAVSASAA